MENWSRFKHDTINNVFGKQRRPTIVGTVVTAVLTIAILVGSVKAGIGNLLILGPALGGATAGAMLGTNAYEGFMYGARAAAYGFLIFSVVIGIGSFVLLKIGTGADYFLISSLVVLILLFAVVPVMGLLGAICGAFGAIVRRMVLPSQYNPPVR